MLALWAFSWHWADILVFSSNPMPQRLNPRTVAF